MDVLPAPLVFRAWAGEPYQGAHPPVYACTYAIRFCHGACTEANAAFRTGKLVLLERPLRDAQGRMRRKLLERGFVNGCLSLDPVHGVSTEAGFFPVDAHRIFVVWSLDPDRRTIHFELDRSPDGGYGIDLGLTPAGLGGSSDFWGGVEGPFAPGSEAPQRDGVTAARVGEPDLSLCARLGVDQDAIGGTFTPSASPASPAARSHRPSPWRH